MRKLRVDEMNRLSTEAFRTHAKMPLVLVLDNIRSMNNVGSVFRTADAFLLEKLMLCGITAQPPHRDIHKTALGAEDTVVWEYIDSTEKAVEKLKAEHYRVYALEQTEGSTMLQDFPNLIDKRQKLAIVLGHEVKGVEQKVVDLCDGCVEIPQYGTKHSLNVSVATGILCWEMAKLLLT